MMTKAERLKRLAELEDKLKIKRRPRVYSRCANDGTWYGDPPPPEGPRPGDTVVNVTYYRAGEGAHGGRPLTAAEMAARRIEAHRA